MRGEKVIDIAVSAQNDVLRLLSSILYACYSGNRLLHGLGDSLGNWLGRGASVGGDHPIQQSGDLQTFSLASDQVLAETSPRLDREVLPGTHCKSCYKIASADCNREHTATQILRLRPRGAETPLLCVRMSAGRATESPALDHQRKTSFRPRSWKTRKLERSKSCLARCLGNPVLM